MLAAADGKDLGEDEESEDEESEEEEGESDGEEGSDGGDGGEFEGLRARTMHPLRQSGILCSLAPQCIAAQVDHP